MPVDNKSENKVRVTRLFGGGATVGFMDPIVDMQVRHGIDDRWVKSLDSGNFQVALAITSGGSIVAKAYPHDLAISTGVADYFGWPLTPVGTVFGTSGVWPDGVPEAIGSGMVYSDGDGETLFSK